MPGLKGRERLQPSLLDRLTDNNRSAKRDGPDEQVLTWPQLRLAVLRDLASLFNTSNLETIADLAEAPLAAKSTINFGIPGFAGLLDNSRRVGTLEEELATAIRAFEPRIRSESLKIRSRGAREESGMAALVFVIEGELWAQPVPQPLFLETKIEVESRTAAISEAKSTE